ncbi:phage terminase large subunit family protein [Algiphilus sp.]|uniref:phage terminase large subunit family protein n=1 Tax=Algiphilus sp. TaxID=1872431 RepID=UPI0025B8B1AA|nr:phage terminase large subunit family protein [Algiphilus sp.]MCK5770921.1 phage terminase large subunit family protein [Algiphilus sp.]
MPDDLRMAEGLGFADGYSTLLSAVAGNCAPRKKLTLSQWSDAHRWLSGKASSAKGRWRTSRTPYLREIMDCLSESSPVSRVVMMKSAQVGGTEVGLNWIGYAMHHAPCPMLVVVPTIEVRERWSIQRLNPLLTETDVLADLVRDRRRDGKNRQDIKDFPGDGLLVLGGANSAASLASMPIKWVLSDEVDRFPWELPKEGDTIGLIDQRTQNFRRRKHLLVSTPTVKDASRIEDEYNESDQRHYYMPCPHCGEGITFEWGNLDWQVDPDHPIYMCVECGGVIEEHHKEAMLAAGEWVPKHPERSHLVRGYHINGLYAPPGLGYTWGELVRQFKSAQNDPPKLQRFINTALGETWEDRSRDVQPRELQNRAEPYGLREIPGGCLIITAGVDTQDDRLAVQLVGWGRGERCWALDWLEYPHSPGDPATWRWLAEYLNRPLENAWGKRMYVEATAVDSGGHYTHEVYGWVRSEPARRVIAIKGANTPNRPILAGRPSHVDVNHAGKVIKGGVALWQVGSDTAKHTLLNRLMADKEAAPADRMIHFSDQLPEDYYVQMLGKVFDADRNKWVQRRGRRAEGMDTWSYACAASHHPALRVHALRERDWRALEKQLQPGTKPDPEAEQAAAPQPAPPPETVTPKRKGRRNDGFNKWRV